MSLELEQQILRPECFAGSDDAGQKRVQLAIPDLAPCVPPGKPQSLRMLRTEDWSVGVVIQNDEFRAPKEHDLRFGWQQHAHCAA